MDNLKKLAAIINANAFIIYLNSNKIVRLTELNGTTENLLNILVNNLTLINTNLYQSLNYHDGHLITCCINDEIVICFAFEYQNSGSENSELMLINSLSHIQSVAQLLYSLYTKKEAPINSIVIKHIRHNFEHVSIFERDSGSDRKKIYDPKARYNLETTIVNAIITSDKSKIEKSLDELSEIHLIKQTTSNHLLQSEKYSLVGYLAVLNRTIIYWGYPIQLATKVHNELIKKIELIDYIPDFFQFVCEITWHYFNIVKEYRVRTFLPLPERIHQYIKEHISENITLNDIAIGLTESKNNLNPSFKTAYGLTIKQFIKQTKINTSKELLLTSTFSIAEISDVLSFTNSSYFVKTFKDINGMTPAFFRKNFFEKHLKL